MMLFCTRSVCPSSQETICWFCLTSSISICFCGGLSCSQRHFRRPGHGGVFFRGMENIHSISLRSSHGKFGLGAYVLADKPYYLLHPLLDPHPSYGQFHWARNLHSDVGTSIKTGSLMFVPHCCRANLGPPPCVPVPGASELPSGPSCL